MPKTRLEELWEYADLVTKASIRHGLKDMTRNKDGSYTAKCKCGVLFTGATRLENQDIDVRKSTPFELLADHFQAKIEIPGPSTRETGSPELIEQFSVTATTPKDTYETILLGDHYLTLDDALAYKDFLEEYRRRVSDAAVAEVENEDATGLLDNDKRVVAARLGVTTYGIVKRFITKWEPV